MPKRKLEEESVPLEEGDGVLCDSAEQCTNQEEKVISPSSKIPRTDEQTDEEDDEEEDTVGTQNDLCKVSEDNNSASRTESLISQHDQDTTESHSAGIVQSEDDTICDTTSNCESIEKDNTNAVSEPSVSEPEVSEPATAEDDGKSTPEENQSNSEADLSPIRRCRRPVKHKKRVHFDGVTVYYFRRKQGFTCVPSIGGSTLGMDEQHHDVEEYSVKEYGKIQKAMHCEILLEQHQQGKIYLPPTKLQSIKKVITDTESALSSACTSDEDIEEQQQQQQQQQQQIQEQEQEQLRQQQEEEEENEEEGEDDDVVVDEYYFLQPITTRQRRLMLRQAGIKKIDTSEKEDCKEIRGSREVCGCDCKVYCDPATCICAQADIQCQVDRMSFPCGCTKDGCANPKGRIEFNPIRVRTHFIHTLMRLETEEKCKEIKSKRKKAGLGRHIRFDDENDGLAKIEDDTDDNDLMHIEGEEEQDEEEAAANHTFNSNERGSCCDCQNSEVNEFLMRESQFANSNGDVEVVGQYNTTPEELQQQQGVVVNGQETGQVMMYSEEEEYHADNPAAAAAATAAMYHQFMKEESCSESSDCSSEGSNDVAAATATAAAAAAANYVYHQVGTASYDGCTNQQQQSTETYNIPSSTDTSSIQNKTDTYIDPPSSTSTYKLEPISQILNPIRVGGCYTESPPSWGGGTSTFCQYDTANQQPQAAAATQASSSGEEHKEDAQGEANQTLLTFDQTAAAANEEDEEEDEEEEQLLDLDSHAHIAPTMSSSCQLLDLDKQSSKPEVALLPPMVTTAASAATVAVSKDEEGGNEKKDVASTASTSTTTTTTTTAAGSGSSTKEGESTDSEDSGLGTEEQSQQQTQNFGEIIKESIVVETAVLTA